MDPRPPASALREIVAVGLFGVPRPMSRAVPILVAHLHGQAKPDSMLEDQLRQSSELRLGGFLQARGFSVSANRPEDAGDEVHYCFRITRHDTIRLRRLTLKWRTSGAKSTSSDDK